MPRRNWNRNETLVAFNLYCRTPFGKLHARNPEIITIALALGRTPSALAMKCCNLAALDTAMQSRGIRGLKGTSRLDEEIWQEFENDSESLAYEAELAHSEIMQQELRTANDVQWEDVQGVNREAVTKVRVNQHFFRSVILSGYRSTCAICALPVPSLLVAAHIVPWAIDSSLRMNPRNGICLCAIHDRSFDNGLLEIHPDYTIGLNANLVSLEGEPAVEAFFTQFRHCSLRLPDRWLPDPALLDRHIQLLA